MNRASCPLGRWVCDTSRALAHRSHHDSSCSESRGLHFLFLAVSITHSFSNSRMQSQRSLVVPHARTLAQTFLGRDFQQEQERAQLWDHGRRSEQEGRGAGGASCSLRGFVCEDTITDPQGLLEIACGNKVETLKGIKGISEIS